MFEQNNNDWVKSLVNFFAKKPVIWLVFGAYVVQNFVTLFYFNQLFKMQGATLIKLYTVGYNAIAVLFVGFIVFGIAGAGPKLLEKYRNFVQ